MTRPRLKQLKSPLATLASPLRVLASPGSWRAGRTTAERGYGARWQRERLQFLRDHPLCRYHEQQGLVVAATLVDHVTPHNGDPILFWNKRNWQPLCKPCHDTTKKEQELRGDIPPPPNYGEPRPLVLA